MTDRPIGPYPKQPAVVADWDPRIVEVHRRVAALINERRPDVVVEHTGSTAVPGLPGKGVLDLGIEVLPDDVAGVAAVLRSLGFETQTNANPFPPTRPLLLGSVEHDGEVFRIHAHVLPRGHRVWGRDHPRDLAFRDALRADAALRGAYAARKRQIVEGGTTESVRYSLAKTEWIRGALERIGVADPPILPPATIGVLGGGQLGRMLALAAREMGYRIAVLDPDALAPAAAVADSVVTSSYDDVDRALEMAERADVVTLELEHVSLDVVRRLDWDWPVRPGVWALSVTQDRIAERRFLEAEGAPVAPWAEARTTEEIGAAAARLGLPLRVKARTGGYDGRSQVRVSDPPSLAVALERLGRPAGESVLVERELDFELELSVVCARAVDGQALTFPATMNRHDEGILVESVAPAPVGWEVAKRAAALARKLAEGLDLVGTLTVEMFLLRDGSLVVNELAPRVHNSGHWTIEGATTSQFEQHIRAITGLPLGTVEIRAPAAATVNVLGVGPERDARPAGIDRALGQLDVHVHLYDKRRVFERRKMGHVTALAATPDAALELARAAAAEIHWT